MKKRPRGKSKDLGSKLFENISNGLGRRAITSAAQWAEKYRMIGRINPTDAPIIPWRWHYVPWLKQMHEDTSEFTVAQKSAQAGFSEWALNLAFYLIDIHGQDILYVLPTKNPDATNFTAARFNPALEMSPHLRSLFSAVDNVSHKRAGNANLYVVGSRARTALKSKPCNVVFLDELEEMVQKNIELAFARTDGKWEKKIVMLSTPSIAGKGINFHFQKTDQSHFFFKCPGCSRMTELVYPQCLVIVGEDPDDPRVNESYLQCKECKVKLPHEDKPNFLANNEWVPQFTNKDGKGWHINQLYSSTIWPGKFAKFALQAKTSPAAEQELYNSKLGLPHSAAGSNIEDADIDRCVALGKGYHTRDIDVAVALRPRTIGIDVGKVNHYVIIEWDIPSKFNNPVDPGPECRGKIIALGSVPHFHELSELITKYQVRHGVIDANPERRKSYELCLKHFGRMHMCYYVRGVQGKQLNAKKDTNEQVVNDEPAVCVDRTSWLDATFARIKAGTIAMPTDISLEYKAHIKALTRRFKFNEDGETSAVYQIAENAEDHFAHAQNYAEIALPFVLGMGVTKKTKRKMF